MAEIRERLATARVVTLLGPGGVGKTRVALRIAEEGSRTYRDGRWVVPLAGLTNPDLLGPTVAEALDLQGADGPIDVETLADHIADSSALFVLDNCEHLLSGVGALVEGLRATCPNLRVLLTSRRPLRISGEAVFVVPPLNLPDQGLWPRRLHQSLRGRQPVPGPRLVGQFRLRADSGQRPGVLALCRGLEGIPLAIELATARIRSLSPQEIGESLTDASRYSTRVTGMPTSGTSR